MLKEIVRELQFIIFRSPFLSPTMCGSKYYPYLPHGSDFSWDPPSLWKFQSSFMHLLTFSPFEDQPPPPPPPNFKFLLWGECGYFLELHNVGRSLSCKFCIIIDYHTWVPKGKIMHNTFCHTTIVFNITMKVKII